MSRILCIYIGFLTLVSFGCGSESASEPEDVAAQTQTAAASSEQAGAAADESAAAAHVAQSASAQAGGQVVEPTVSEQSNQADPCLNDPCGQSAGRGTCQPTPSADQPYTCSCSAGLTFTAGTCGCDLSGTFAVRRQLTVSWGQAAPLEGGSDTQYLWEIARHTANPDGTLGVDITHCGESNVDLCSEGVAASQGISDVLGGLLPNAQLTMPAIPAEAYAQYVPVSVWNAQTVSSHVVTSVAAPWPAQPYTLPRYAALQGISLSDALGAWPESLEQVSGGGSDVVNGAQWVNVDGDDQPGLTTLTVGPNGAVADGSASAPLATYEPTSKVCPRSNTSAARYPYNYPPVLDGLSIRRITRVFSANRVISELTGTIDSCDQLSGLVNNIQLDSRIQGCAYQTAGGEALCDDNTVKSLDAQAAAYEVLGSSFLMQRVPDGTTCEQVRAALPQP